MISPSLTIDGKEYPVTEIREGAFDECNSLSSITVPDSIENVNASFYNFSSVHLPDYFKNYDYDTLRDDFGLFYNNQTIYFGDQKVVYNQNFDYDEYPFNTNPLSIITVEKTMEVDGNDYSYQIASASNYDQGKYLFLTHYNFELSDGGRFEIPQPSTMIDPITRKPFINDDGKDIILDTIGKESFEHSPITSVEIPEGYKVVQYRAFADSDVESIVFPSTIEYYGQDLFEYCENLKKVTINVSSENKDDIIPILPENIGYYGPSDNMIIEYKDENGRVLSSMTYGELQAKYPSNDDDYGYDYFDDSSNDYEEPAPDFVSNGISYNIDEETKHLTVCAIDDNLGKEVSIPKEIVIEGKKYTVFSIDQNAISSDSDVETLNLPYICYEDASWLLCNSNCQVNFYNESGQTVESATVQELYEDRISWVKKSEASGHYEGYDKAVIDEIKDKSINSLVIPHKYDTSITNLDPELYSDEVVGIGKNILDSCNNVEKVCISYGVDLPDGVFANCDATEYVLPENYNHRPRRRNGEERPSDDPSISLKERLGIRPDATITFANRYYENLNDPDIYKVLPVELTYSEKYGQFADKNGNYSNKTSLKACLDNPSLKAALSQASDKHLQSITPQSATSKISR